MLRFVKKRSISRAGYQYRRRVIRQGLFSRVEATRPLLHEGSEVIDIVILDAPISASLRFLGNGVSRDAIAESFIGDAVNSPPHADFPRTIHETKIRLAHEIDEGIDDNPGDPYEIPDDCGSRRDMESGSTAPLIAPNSRVLAQQREREREKEREDVLSGPLARRPEYSA